MYGTPEWHRQQRENQEWRDQHQRQRQQNDSSPEKRPSCLLIGCLLAIFLVLGIIGVIIVIGVFGK